MSLENWRRYLWRRETGRRWSGILTSQVWWNTEERWRHRRLKKMKCWRSFQPSAPNMSNDSTEVLEKHCRWEHQTYPEGWEESLMLPYWFYLCLASPDLEGKKEAAPVRTSSHISKCGDEPRWTRSCQIHLHDLCSTAKVCPDVEPHVVNALLWTTFCLGKDKKPCWASFCISAVFWGQTRHLWMEVQAQLCHWCALPPLRKERCPMIPCPRYTLSGVFHAERTVPGLPQSLVLAAFFPPAFSHFPVFPIWGLSPLLASQIPSSSFSIFIFYQQENLSWEKHVSLLLQHRAYVCLENVFINRSWSEMTSCKPAGYHYILIYQLPKADHQHDLKPFLGYCVRLLQVSMILNWQNILSKECWRQSACK